MTEIAMRNLDPDLLRAFLSVTRHLSFTRAAEELNRTQAAVSMQIKRLEDALGQNLFFRQHKTVTLLPEGEMLIDYARRILALNDEAWHRIAHPEVEGLVRIGTPDDYAASYLPPVLTRFAANFPRVRVDVLCEMSTDLIGKVQKGALDMALLTRVPDLLEGRTVRREPLVWVGKDDSPALREHPLPLALFPEGCLFRDLVADRLEAEGRDWRLAYSSPSLSALTAAVSAGLAISVLTEASVPQGFTILDGLPPLPPVEIALYERPGLRSAAQIQLAAHIFEKLGQPEFQEVA